MNNVPTKRLATTLLAFVVSATASTLAQSSATSISFQGALSGPGDQNLPNGSYTLGFQFWDHPTATAATNRVGGAITVAGVVVSGGVASTAVPVQPAWFNGQTRYLGITVQGVNASQELLPRVLVTAVPYAISAATLGNSIFVGTNGNVGIGTKEPHVGLDIRTEVESGRISVLTGGQGLRIDSDFRNVSETETARFAAHDPFWNIFDMGLSVNYRNQGGSAQNFDVLRAFKEGTVLFVVKGDGNVGVGTQAPSALLEVAGTTRTAVLQITSARAAKEDFTPVDAAAVLAKVAALPIATWAYTNSHGVRHLGPVAEDFHAAFALGDSAQHIATVDADGVALAAIQGLYKLVTAQQTALCAREAEVQSLQKRLEKLEHLVTELAGQRSEAR